MLMTCGKTRRNHVWGGPVKKPGSPHAFADHHRLSLQSTRTRGNPGPRSFDVSNPPKDMSNVDCFIAGSIYQGSERFNAPLLRFFSALLRVHSLEVVQWRSRTNDRILEEGDRVNPYSEMISLNYLPDNVPFDAKFILESNSSRSSISSQTQTQTPIILWFQIVIYPKAYKEFY